MEPLIPQDGGEDTVEVRIDVKPEPHSLNEFVLIRVTLAGEKAWDDYHKERQRSAEYVDVALPAASLERDHNGYTRMLLYDVMKIFGQAMLLASPDEQPIDEIFKFVD